MEFVAEITVRFAHVDAAGIVFYPRYAEMLNEVIERWFSEALDLPIEDLVLVHERGIPMRQLSLEFLKPSMLGDRLHFGLAVSAVGASSIALDVTCRCGDEERLTAQLTLVYTSLRPLSTIRIPDTLRTRMLEFRKAPHPAVMDG